MAYNYVQFISYQLSTFPKKEYHLDGSYNVGPVANVPGYDVPATYLGEALASEDISKRVRLMREAVEKAFARHEVSVASGCLKVFMAPEFYFRGDTGSYTMDNYQVVVRELRKIVRDTKYKNWLFIFGSVLASYDQSDSEVHGSRGGMAGKKTVVNVVLCQKGGQGEEGSHAIVKEHMSGIDFVKTGIHVQYVGGNPSFVFDTHLAKGQRLDDVDHLAAGKLVWQNVGPGDGVQAIDPNTGVSKETVGSSIGRTRYAGLGIFEIDGVTIGLEVCLDHLMRRLATSPPGLGENWVQVQLVPSAGMSIQDNAVVATRGGYVFNCDGGEPHSAVKHVDMDKGTAIAMTAVPSEFSVQLHTTGTGPADLASCFQGGAQLQIYPSKPLPPARTV